MELVYLWVDGYKNIKKQGFNFSPQSEYTFDNENLTFTEKNEDEYIKDFFDDNINVTAIVGKNGSGKSSVLECLHSLINDKKNINFKYILVYKIDEINYTSNITINTDITKRDIRQVEYHIYSNDSIEYKNQIDIRKESVLKNLISNSLQNDFELTTFMYIPTSIEITKIHINDEFYEVLTFNPNNIHYDEALSPEENKRKTDELIDTLEYLRANIENDYHKFLIILFISVQDPDELYGLENIDSLKERLQESDIGYLEKEEFDKYFSTIDNEPKPINRLIDRDKEIYLEYSYLFTFDFIDSKNRRYNRLSHGERTIFGQFLSIYYLSIKSHVKNLLYLLDEAELSLHPNWQKQYLNEMILLLKNIEKKFYIIFSSHSPFLLSDIFKQNSIFLDTYDEGESEQKYPNLNFENLTNGDCINVTNELDIKPFGANIHNLLSHGFFMEDGLMGKFAENKIQEIIKFFNRENKSDKFHISQRQIKLIIESIGEDLLRMKLLDMYYEEFKKDELEKEKQQLIEKQKEITKLIESIKEKQRK